uniref:Uncharacterized protein n=1 Tax=Glossina pallidipes TaxID=7398 RepID=A0A1A9ZJ68_GLOPL
MPTAIFCQPKLCDTSRQTSTYNGSNAEKCFSFVLAAMIIAILSTNSTEWQHSNRKSHFFIHSMLLFLTCSVVKSKSSTPPFPIAFLIQRLMHALIHSVVNTSKRGSGERGIVIIKNTSKGSKQNILSATITLCPLISCTSTNSLAGTNTTIAKFTLAKIT